MSKPTLNTIDSKLEQVIVEVSELKSVKADKDILVLELQGIRKDIQLVQSNVDTLNGYGKWIILLIMGAVVTAVLKLVLV